MSALRYRLRRLEQREKARQRRLRASCTDDPVSRILREMGPDRVDEMTRNYRTRTGRDEKGRFGPGNPGRPKGARHRTTLAVEALLDGEAEQITRRAIELALEGDTTAMRLCLERIAPPRRESPVRFDLPEMQSVLDAARAAASVLKAVSEGELSPGDGAHVMGLVEAYRRALEFSDLENRIAALEAQRG